MGIHIMTVEKVVVTRSFDKITLSTVCVKIDNGWSIIVGLKWKDWKKQTVQFGWDSIEDCPWSIEWRRRFCDAIEPLCDRYVEQYCVVHKKVLSKNEEIEIRLGLRFALIDAMPTGVFLPEHFKKHRSSGLGGRL